MPEGAFTQDASVTGYLGGFAAIMSGHKRGSTVTEKVTNQVISHSDAGFIEGIVWFIKEKNFWFEKEYLSQTKPFLHPG